MGTLSATFRVAVERATDVYASLPYPYEGHIGAQFMTTMRPLYAAIMTALAEGDPGAVRLIKEFKRLTAIASDFMVPPLPSMV